MVAMYQDSVMEALDIAGVLMKMVKSFLEPEEDQDKELLHAVVSFFYRFQMSSPNNGLCNTKSRIFQLQY